MRLHEYEALEIFEQNRIPVPRRGVAETMHQALHVAGEIGYPVVVKAQVLVGGRGLVGGVRMASTPERAERGSRCAAWLRHKGIAGPKTARLREG